MKHNAGRDKWLSFPRQERWYGPLKYAGPHSIETDVQVCTFDLDLQLRSAQRNDIYLTLYLAKSNADIFL
jgi:hypothetical protein